MNQNLSELIILLSGQKQQKKKIEQDLKLVDGTIAKLEEQIIHAMDDEGIIESKSAVGKVKIDESVYPHVEDWSAFHAFIQENNYMFMLEKRPAVLAYREQLQLGRAVPGVVPFTKRKLSYRES